jgi:hypothetical protein
VESDDRSDHRVDREDDEAEGCRDAGVADLPSAVKVRASGSSRPDRVKETAFVVGGSAAMLASHAGMKLIERAHARGLTSWLTRPAVEKERASQSRLTSLLTASP